MKPMDTYPSESELVAALDRHDELLRLCAAGRLPFWDFCAAYDNFYWRYALDGHEADPAGQALLDKLAVRIAPHRELAERVLASVCSDTHPEKGSYGKAGRFGPDEALVRLKLVAAGLATGRA